MPMVTGDTEPEQQMLVQWCMSAQVFSEPEFRQTIRRIHCIDEGKDMEEILPVVEQINGSMSAFSLELRSAMDQTSGVRMWALVNTNADPISIGATPYTASELIMLKTLVEGVFTEGSGNYSMSFHDALRLATKRGGTRAEVESLLRRFTGDGWLALDEGFVVLGARSIIELQSYFNTGFADYIRLCSLCKEMATSGVVCMECQEAVHPYCAGRVAEANGGQLSCPKCNRHIRQPWKFGPGERGVPHALESGALEAKEENVGVEEPATQSIKKLRIEDSSDEE
ncbi:hypothetical protein IWW37_002390 [Coemansia sp. RSA 2050]|nr:hypothetical protein IWW37_002390 [Coemansia sp. RSA 2050]